MNIQKVAGIFFLCFLAHGYAFSQNRNTIPASKDTSKAAARPAPVVKDSARLALEAMPRRAVIRSAILPGLGQITNKRWWKVPLIYGGFVGLGLVYQYNEHYYKIFLKEAQFRELNPGKTENPLYAVYSTEGIIAVKDDARRNRDLTILAGIGFYAINIIDAYIDAKFFRFDISDELSLKVVPVLNQPAYMHAFSDRPSPGIKISLSL
jgi:hypothetical protein